MSILTETVSTYDDEDGGGETRTVTIRNNRNQGNGDDDIVEVNSFDGEPCGVSIVGRENDYSVEEAEAFAADLMEAIREARRRNSSGETLVIDGWHKRQHTGKQCGLYHVARQRTTNNAGSGEELFAVPVEAWEHRPIEEQRPKAGHQWAFGEHAFTYVALCRIVEEHFDSVTGVPATTFEKVSD